MAIYTFGDDTITDLPTSGSTTSLSSGSAPFTFNPFATVTSVVDSAGADSVTLRLGLIDLFIDSNPPPQTDGAVLHSVDNGTTSTIGLGSSVFFTGTSAQTLTWLQNIFVVNNSLQDRFSVVLRGVRDNGSLTTQTRTYSYIIACFLQGTMIATPAGERAVEALQAGDMVTTLDGSAKPVKWIGHRSYEAEFGATEAFVRPVVFKAGSLGAGLPVRDLKVSPQHAMLIDGVMVPAAALVNGVSIVRDGSHSDVTYFHIELDGHEAVFAEGAASETFVDHNSRAMFDNADEYGLVFGSASVRPTEQPRLEEGYELAAIRRRLAGIAGIATNVVAGPITGNLEAIQDGVLSGWMIDTVSGEAVEAEVLVAGEVVGRVVANRYRTDLDQAGLAGGRGGFTTVLPAGVDSLSQVSLRRIVDGQLLAAPATETVGA